MTRLKITYQNEIISKLMSKLALNNKHDVPKIQKVILNMGLGEDAADGKKLKAVIDGKKTIHFGQAGANDFTKHKDLERKANYISRHSNEDWSKSNVASPAFMSRWVTWHKPTLQASVNDLNKRYKDINFKLKK